MLPSKHRIRKRKEFENIFKRGKTTKGRFFIIKYADNKDGGLRFAFVFPIKEEKSACRRNRAKRIFREVAREVIKDRKEKKDIICIIKKEAKGKSFLEVKEEFVRVLEKIK